ncbi:MAG: CBS domain-containing protein [Deltaproteobacteria bacterium]|nr:MAG: CBS domain-containing protein [Deltaproteobacteria bacterium]
MNKTVRDILRSKGPEVFSIDAEATVFEALEMMADKNVGALLVTKNGKCAGMFSERDYARRVILRGLSSPKTKIAEVMTDTICFARPDQTVEECMALITEKRCRHLPVFDGDSLVGMVSIGDLVKASIAEKEFMINQLENYIRHG